MHGRHLRGGAWPDRFDELKYHSLDATLRLDVAQELVGMSKERLGDLLGDDHDLAVLRREVAGDPERFGGPETLQPLLARIDRRRQKLERDAVILGRKVFRDPPQTFGRRLRGYWKTGHD
jgi:hypothetical protein